MNTKSIEPIWRILFFSLCLPGTVAFVFSTRYTHSIRSRETAAASTTFIVIQCIVLQQDICVQFHLCIGRAMSIGIDEARQQRSHLIICVRRDTTSQTHPDKIALDAFASRFRCVCAIVLENYSRVVSDSCWNIPHMLSPHESPYLQLRLSGDVHDEGRRYGRRVRIWVAFDFIKRHTEEHLFVRTCPFQRTKANEN